MLMQGLELPHPRPCSLLQLPPTINRPSSPPPSPVHPLVFEEPKDTYGQARVRAATIGSTTSTALINASITDSSTTTVSNWTTNNTSSTAINNSTTTSGSSTTTTTSSIQLTEASEVPAPQQTVTVTTREASRTTLWRLAKKRQQQLVEGITLPPQEKRPREYRCSTCRRPMAGKLK